MPEDIIQKIKSTASSPLTNEALNILKKNMKEDELFYPHSLRTALILKEMGAEEETIICGILHHIPENRLSLKDASKKTKDEITTILKKANQLRELFSLQKIFKPKPLKKWQKIFLNQQAENLRKMFFAIAQDIRPIFVTLAGRLDEMRNLAVNYPPQEQKKKSLTALEILSPLAYGIGMGEIKGQLEDLAFPYLYLKEYNWLVENVEEKYAEREKYLERVKPVLMKILAGERIAFLDIHARAKHYFSLYQKLLRHNMDVEEIYDLVALRIIVPDIATCYKVLGAIHKTWSPLPGRIKDYISSPKPNGYRSLHTTVFCQEGKIVELQIKTLRMHHEAEYGVAAHLEYKEKLPKKAYKYQFYWMEQLRKWKEEVQDVNKLSEYLKSELFKDQIFVLTPKGDVVSLPKDATPVDFAYAVHSEVGDHCQGAKINGKMVSLNQVLKNGETIEIITDKNKIPTSDWLRFVKTNKARSKITSFLQKAYGISPKKAERKSSLREKVSVLRKILPIKKKEPQVSIGGQTGISVNLSKCCSPKPGDKILGFITKGKGASLHKRDCASLRELQQKWPQRIVQATWKVIK